MTESHGTPENPQYINIPEHSTNPADPINSLPGDPIADPTEFIDREIPGIPPSSGIPTNAEYPAAARYFDIPGTTANSNIPSYFPPLQQTSTNPANYPGTTGLPSDQAYPGDPSLIANLETPIVPSPYDASGVPVRLSAKQKLYAQWKQTQQKLIPWWHRFMLLEVLLYILPTIGLSFPPVINFFPIIPKLILLPWKILATVFLRDKAHIDFGPSVSDTPLGYFYFFAILIFSAVIAAIWAVIEKKSTHSKITAVITYIWKNGLRLSLAAFLLYYGAIKILPVQMHVPWPTELAKPIGNQDGVGYLWHFIGFSPIFEALVGIAQFIGGILLLIPRFQVFGGYLSLGLMLPITVLNFCYDIPDKLVSFVVTIALIILLWFSITALYAYLFRKKGVKPLVQQKLISLSRTWLRLVCIIIYIVLSVGFAFSDVVYSLGTYYNTQLNPDLPINGRWIITGRQVFDQEVIRVLPQQWTGLDITATNDPSFSQFNVEIDMGPFLGASHMDFRANYSERYVEIGTKNAGLLPYNLVFNYIMKGDTLTLLSLNADTNRATLLITASRAPAWPHHPGEFRWTANPTQVDKDILDP